MELVFPGVLYIGIPIVILFPFLKWKKEEKYREGKKVANTDFIEATPLYQKLLKQYKLFCNMTLVCLLGAILVCVIMIARPATIEKISPEIHNRDIFLCMDISDSVDELNLEVCDKLRDVVKRLNGERFGISIFNGQSVLLVPLTTDYNYVLDTLDKLEDSFKDNLGLPTNSDIDRYYKYEGTLADYGSSFIGDGLASCLYSFPDLKEDTERTRLIVFTTDNELNGTPLVTLDEAAGLCAKNNVKVFAIAPDNIVDEDAFEDAIERTGGEYYQAADKGVFEDLVEQIENTEASKMQEEKTIIRDQPKVFFIVLVMLVSCYFLLGRKVKL